jgi:hypothetical protein
MATFWAPGMKQKFHSAVEELYNQTQYPVDAVYYGSSNLHGLTTNGYILRPRDELLLADHIALLAAADEGARTISAVCIEERNESLVFHLARNEGTSEKVLVDLTQCLDSVKEGLAKSRSPLGCAPKPTRNANIVLVQSREIIVERLFERVVDMSTDRILQRLRPPWVKVPAFYRDKYGRPRSEPPLWETLQREVVSDIAAKSEMNEIYTPIRTKIENLAEALMEISPEPLQGQQNSQVRPVLRNIIEKCAELSYQNGHRSLEEQLRVVPGLSKLAASKPVAQVDKLSRYLGLCKDIVRMAKRRRYNSIFKEISISPLPAYRALTPPGASKACYVHAEIQMALYLEEHPPDRPPRVIGCSKSACFLCDLFIQKQGKYSISSAHRQLHNQWTIPDTPWISSSGAETLRRIVTSMLEYIRRLSMQAKSNPQVSKPYPRQSMARLWGSHDSMLALSSVLTAFSNLSLSHSLRKQPVDRQFLSSREPTPTRSLRSSSTLQEPVTCRSAVSVGQPTWSNTTSSLSLREVDLPFQKRIHLKTASFLVAIDGLSLLFEFDSVRRGQVSVKAVTRQRDLCAKEQIRQISASEIPTSHNLVLRCPVGSSDLSFQLHHGTEASVEIWFDWDPESDTHQNS